MSRPFPPPSTDVSGAGNRGDWAGGVFHRPDPDGPIRWTSPTALAAKRWTATEAARDANRGLVDPTLDPLRALTLERFRALPHAFPPPTPATRDRPHPDGPNWTQPPLPRP